ncbi:helix-turn-helix domain-containing protein [Aeoliella sp. SH292]|uniref:helix-turn-helix domain-containing protein n=1 Tax=Aeoliella sp. SH292 TaxID=3454464 RepID=UPI003F9AC1F2
MKFEPSEIESLAAALATCLEEIVEDKLASIVASSKVPEILSTEQAALFMGVDAQTIRREARRGRLPHLKVGKKNRYRRQDLLAVFEVPVGRKTTLPFSEEKQEVAQFN